MLYLTPLRGAPTEIDAYDLDTGLRHEVGLGTDVGWYVRAVDGAGGLVVDGGAVLAVSHGATRTIDDGGNSDASDSPNGRVAPGPSGGVWVRGFAPPAIELVDATGARTGRRYDLPRGAELFGSMADGRPVVRSEDRRVAVIEPDGSRRPLADNAQAPVEAGRFVEVRCDRQQRCTALAHIDQRTVDLGSTRSEGGVERRYRFQPDGPFVAISEGDHLSLRDTTTGAVPPAVVTGVTTAWFGDDDLMNARFLPGGLGLVAQTDKGLVFIDLTGRTIARIPVEPTNMPGGPLLGVGRARFWER